MFSFPKFPRKKEKISAPQQEKMTTDNILDVFSRDMKAEKAKTESQKLVEWAKDQVYYIKKATLACKVLFFVSLFFALLSYGYAYIQKSDSFENISYFTPICHAFISENVQQELGQCVPLSSAKTWVDEKIKKTYQEQADQIMWVLPDVYALDNFLFSNEIAFLVDKSANKLQVTQILKEFNLLKDTFEPSKWVYAVECDDITINNNAEVTLSCSSYSSDWSDSNIVGFDGQINSKKISGTSITVASSFINFIKNKSQDFKVLEATKTFSYEEQVDEGKERYTRKTDFEMVLGYSPSLAK